MMMVFASGPMGMRLGSGGGHERLPWKDDMARLVLLGQMVSDLRMIGSHVPDEAAEEALRLKILP